MHAIFELYANAYLPAAGIRRPPHRGERRGDVGSDGELPVTCIAPEVPRQGAIYAFILRLSRETTAARLWQHRRDAQL
jgi:hypothetical protein